jgi:hypothetical protein
VLNSDIQGFCPAELAGKYLRGWKHMLFVLCLALFSCNGFPSGTAYHFNFNRSKEAINTCFARHGIMPKKHIAMNEMLEIFSEKGVAKFVFGPPSNCAQCVGVQLY